MPLQLNFNTGGDLEDRTLFDLNVQPVIPFSASQNWNVIARTIVPINSIPGRDGTRFSGAPPPGPELHQNGTHIFMSFGRLSRYSGSFRWGSFRTRRTDRRSPGPEDPLVYRQGHLMLAIISHEGFGELRISKREEEMLATLGVRGGYLEGDQPCTSLSIGPTTITILPHEFPCLSGGPEDDWLRVHFNIESIPRVVVGYSTLDVTLQTLDGWRRRMEAMLAGAANEATLHTVRPGFSLRMTRPVAGVSIGVVVDGRQMDADLPGHLWAFNVEPADVARLCGECAMAVREYEGRPGVRPPASLPNDPERAIKVGRRCGRPSLAGTWLPPTTR